MIKKCNKCGEEKMAHPDFFRIAKNKNGSWRPGAVCRKCESAYTVQRCKDVQQHKKPHVRAYKKEWNINNKDRIANAVYKRNFGITLDDVNAMADRQDQKCAICKTPIVWENKHSHNVDHRHGDGLVRGILCSKCNRGIGYFNDDPALFQSAITYLKSFNKVSFEVSEIPEESRGQTMATN